MSTRLFTFVGGSTGSWRVRSRRAFIGEALPSVAFVDVINGLAGTPSGGSSLSGVTSNDRYVVRSEKQALVSTQQGLSRPGAARRSAPPALCCASITDLRAARSAFP
jgi:hypothetical protein